MASQTSINGVPLLAMLIRRGVVTVDESRATVCCGMFRDEDGFCVSDPLCALYVPLNANQRKMLETRQALDDVGIVP